MIEAARHQGKKSWWTRKVMIFALCWGDDVDSKQIGVATSNGDWQSEQDLVTKAQNLREQLQLEALLLTRSEEGMSLFTADQVYTVPASAREVYDVSGAGDTVIASVAVMLAEGRSMQEAVEIANRAAALWSANWVLQRSP